MTNLSQIGSLIQIWKLKSNNTLLILLTIKHFHLNRMM